MATSPPRWVVQSNLGSRRDIDAIVQACASLGLDCREVTAIPFSDELPDVPTDVATVFYGSSNFVTNVHRSGRWRPGAFFDEASFQFTQTLAHYGANCLNAQARITTMGQLAAEGLAPDTRLFVRPVADLKEFAGTPFAFGEFRDWVARLDGDGFTLGPTTPIVVAPIRRIDHEWRLFIADGLVASGSHYRRDGVLDVAADVAARVVAFAEEMAARWSPSPVFVLDVAECDGELSVIEINGFNSSGFYASDIEAIVDAVSRAVRRHYP